MVPVFMATPTSACASAGASLVPSPVMATSLPCCCSLRMSSILASGVASARKSSTPASLAMAAAVSGLSPVIMTVRMPIARSWSKRSRMPPLTMSLRWMTPRARSSRATASGVPPCIETCSIERSSSAGTVAAALADPGDRRRRRRPCGCDWPSRSMPLMRVWARERDERRLRRGRCGGRGCRSSLASTTIERPSGVSSASEASWAASASSVSVDAAAWGGTRPPGGCPG